MPLILNGDTGISGVDGSAGTPSYQGNDSNTGVFFPAADTIAFAEGGAEIARFDSSGNLGIGTNSPTKRLSLKTSSTDVGITLATGTNTNNQDIDFLNNIDGSSGRIRYYPDNGTLSFWTANVERVRIDSNGGFGIGTTSISAQTRLAVAYVNQVTDARGILSVNSTNAAATNLGGSISLGGENGQATTPYVFAAISGRYEGSGYSGFLQLSTTNSGGTVTERMRINSTGGVSIGTTTALATLTVNGNITPVQAPSSNWGIDFAPSTAAGSFVTMANDATYDLAAGSGLVYVYDNAGNGVAQYFAFFGSVAVTNITGGFFSGVINTAGKVNFYYESGVARYRFQNKTGSTVNLFISTIRLRASA